MRSRSGSTQNMVEPDVEFHRAIVGQSGSHQLQAAWDRIAGPVATILGITDTSYRDPQNAIAGQARLLSEIEQDQCSRVPAMRAVAKSRQPPSGSDRLVDDLFRSGINRNSLALNAAQAVHDQRHAIEAGTGVRIANRENPGGNGRLWRLAVPAGHGTRRHR